MSMFHLYIVVAFILFAAFFIGLNLGIHGNVSRLETSIMNDIRYLESKIVDTTSTATGISNSEEVTSTTTTTTTSSLQASSSSSTTTAINNPSSSKTTSDTRISSTFSDPKQQSGSIANNNNNNNNYNPPPLDGLQLISATKATATTGAILAPTVERKIKSLSKKRMEIHKKVLSVTDTPVYKSVMGGELSTLRKAVSTMPISSYITTSSIPILLMTCNRPELLRGTLKSLLGVRGVKKEDIIVSQDGNLQEISDIVQNEFKLDLVQNTEGLNLRGGYRMDGAERIARHYRFSLTHAFGKKPNAAAVIIVEDDLLFSPDFYEYFNNVAPILDIDKSLFVISAWNDNGFKGKVEDSLALHRTEFFPGLGWLLPRALYKGELEASWPSQHWDHWLRSNEVHKGREILYPEVPRTFHNGIKGTFMDISTHNRYFRDIDYNLDSSVSWVDVSSSSGSSSSSISDSGGIGSSNRDDIWGHALQLSYEKRIIDLIATCHHASSINDINSAKGVVCVWISAHPDRNEDFDKISQYFHIWHEHKRGSHKGVHNFYWGNDKYILMINVHDAYRRAYGKYRPASAAVFYNDHFTNNQY